MLVKNVDAVYPVYNFAVAYSPRYSIAYNENDYDAMYANMSAAVPAQTNRWVEVTLTVYQDKNVVFKVGGTILYTLNVQAWGNRIGKSIDLTLLRVGCDLHSGTVLIDDVVVDTEVGEAPYLY